MPKQQQFEFMDGSVASKRPGSGMREYAGLYLSFFKLYFEGRILVAQNLFLSIKLRLWELAFLYVRFQIFLIRLAHGFPVNECWPRNQSPIQD